MTDKELKRLSRGELLQILVDQSIEINSLQLKLARTKAALDERNLQIAESGTLAEAALRLNRIFADADAAAAQYLENVRRMEAEWIEKTGGKPAEPGSDAESAQTDGESQSDDTAESETAQSVDSASESSASGSKAEHPRKKRNKSRHKR